MALQDVSGSHKEVDTKTLPNIAPPIYERVQNVSGDANQDDDTAYNAMSERDEPPRDVSPIFNPTFNMPGYLPELNIEVTPNSAYHVEASEANLSGNIDIISNSPPLVNLDDPDEEKGNIEITLNSAYGMGVDVKAEGNANVVESDEHRDLFEVTPNSAYGSNLSVKTADMNAKKSAELSGDFEIIPNLAYGSFQGDNVRP